VNHDLNIIKLKTDDIERGPGSWIMNLKNIIIFDYFKHILLNGGYG